MLTDAARAPGSTPDLGGLSAAAPRPGGAFGGGLDARRTTGRRALRGQHRRPVRRGVDVPRPRGRPGRVEGGPGGAGRSAARGGRRGSTAGRAVADAAPGLARCGRDQPVVVPAPARESADFARPPTGQATDNGPMPEMPEVESLARFLTEKCVGHTIARIELAGLQRPEDLRPAAVGSARAGDRRGEHGTASSSTSPPRACTWSSIWLGRAGCAGGTQLPAAPASPGGARRPCGSGWTTTPASTSPRPARSGNWRSTWWTTRTPFPHVATLGPDPLSDDFDEDALAALLQRLGRAQLKGVLRDQKNIAGIGNAYSDEILHAARLSPFKPANSLGPEELATLYARHPGRVGRGHRAGQGSRRRGPEGREEVRDAGARPQGLALPGMRGHRRRGVLRTIPRCSTARPARPAARSSPIAGCPDC